MTALPKIQNAQYGDSAKLEQLGATRITNNPAASVQQGKEMAGGRPVETDPVKLATRAATRGRSQQGQRSPEQDQFQRKFDTMAIQHVSVLKWIKLASSPTAGPLTKGYARAAIEAYKKNLLKTRQTSPFFED